MQILQLLKVMKINLALSLCMYTEIEIKVYINDSAFLLIVIPFILIASECIEKSVGKTQFLNLILLLLIDYLKILLE